MPCANGMQCVNSALHAKCVHSMQCVRHKNGMQCVNCELHAMRALNAMCTCQETLVLPMHSHTRQHREAQKRDICQRAACHQAGQGRLQVATLML